MANALMARLTHGGTVVLQERFDPEAVVRLIAAELIAQKFAGGRTGLEPQPAYAPSCPPSSAAGNRGGAW
jgi:hypothetical protein